MKVDKCPGCGMNLVQRSHEQNAGMHVLFDAIASQMHWPPNSGQHIDGEAMKRLLIAAYERTQGRSAEAYPALDGQGYDFVYRRSSRMSKREASEFLEYVHAFCAEQGLNVGLGVAA